MSVQKKLTKYYSFLKSILLGILGSLLIFLIVMMSIAWSIYRYGQNTALRHADAALVLGAAAWGERPSPVFRERINHAINLYQAKQVRMLIFTGGTPKPGYPTEAAVARRYAIDNGIPSQDILIEDQSRTTYDNLRNVSRDFKPLGINTFLVVSDPTHMRRAMLMAEDLRLTAYPSPTPSSRYHSIWSQSRFLLQETQNYIAYRLFRCHS